MPAQLTRIAVRPARDQLPADVELRSGLIAARLIERTPTEAVVALLAGGAMLLAGDQVRIEIDVSAGMRLRLVEIGGTVAYGGGSTALDIDIRIDEGASLHWDARPTVIADLADLARTTRVRLEHGAGLLLRETIVLGRAGEVGGRVVARTRINDPDGPILIEDLCVDGRAPAPGVLAGSRVLDSVFATEEVSTASGCPAGVTRLQLERGGELKRWLGMQLHESPFEGVAEIRPAG